MNSKAKGYILGSIAAASYGTNPLFALPLYSAGMSAESVLFWRYLAAIPMLAMMIKVRGRSFGVSGKQLITLVILGIVLAISSLSLFMAYNYMDAGIASTILFVYPIIVAVIMAAMFKEKISVVTVLSIIMAVGGIGLLFKGDGGTGSLSVIGTILVLVSSLTYAIYIVAVNKTSLANVATLTTTFYVLLFGVSVFAICMCLSGEVQVPQPTEWYMWGFVAGLALFPTAISFVCTTGAIQYIGSTPTAILGALEPVTAVVIGVTVFGELLTGRVVIGLLLIIIAVTMVIASKQISHALVRIRRLFPRIKTGR